MPKAGDHIVIVGGTSGLGFSIAQEADALGARVTIAGRGRDRSAELARSISPRAAGLHIDLEDSRRSLTARRSTIWFSRPCMGSIRA